jgi:hypothetical protein
MSLDTLANVKTRLGITGSGDDSLLSLLQDSADRFIANYCERDFEGGNFTEQHAGGSEFVHLRNYPVSSVTSVKVDPSYGFGAETVIPSTAYVVHSDRGVIQSIAGNWLDGPRVVQVVYATATSAVPNDVKEAYARLIGHWYRMVKTEAAAGHQNIQQQKLGDTFVIYGPGGERLGVPEDVAALLAPYRAPRV